MLLGVVSSCNNNNPRHRRRHVSLNDYTVQNTYQQTSVLNEFTQKQQLQAQTCWPSLWNKDTKTQWGRPRIVREN